MKRWRTDPIEENFWGVVLAYAGVKFKTYSGLPLPMKYEKAEAANTQRSFGLIAERIVKVWHGVRCCWHYGI